MAAVEAVELNLARDGPVDLSSDVYKYFYRTNYINKSILLEEKCFKKHLENQWENIPPERKDALLDLMFVDEEVRKRYRDGESTAASRKSNKSTDFEIEDVEESFPRHFINSGQKINVDFENELWTWRDEHSGPFSWMSRSQQDLTLADLEPENILKPQPKQLRVDLDDESSQRKAEPQFTHPCNSWCQDVLEGFKKHQGEIVLTPSPSLDFNHGIKTGSSIEELNPAFEGSTENLSAQSSPEKSGSRESSPEKESSFDSSEKKTKKKDRGRKSPSPKKMLTHSGSFKKSPVKKSEKGKEERLLDKREESFLAEAYVNPALESEWSNFVGDDQSCSHITEAPEAQTMDRGGECGVVSAAPSPYRGDQVRLISESEDSPAQPRSAAPSAVATTSDYSDWSAESTPDHKTHLLKGLQSPLHQAPKGTTSQVPPFTYDQSSQLDTSAKRNEMGEQNDAKTFPTQAEELLTVVMEGDDVQVTSQEVKKRESNIPSTGFDFLDNW